MLLWFVAIAGIPQVFVAVLDTFLQLTLVFYLIPIVLLTIHAFFNESWPTDGALAHLIVDSILWLFIYLSHVFARESTKFDYFILGMPKTPEVTEIDDTSSPRAKRYREIFTGDTEFDGITPEGMNEF